MRARCVVLALLFLAGISPAWAAGNLPVQQLTLERKSADYNITILYPRTGNDTIDRQVADWVKAQADWFANVHKGQGPVGAARSPASLDGSFAVIRNDREMFEILFEFSTYEGGAHPNQHLHTMNFLLPDGARFHLAEVLEYGGMARVSELATENLIKEIGTGDDAASTPDMIRSGTQVRPGNFETFSIMKNALVLYFSPYEVGPYAAGPQKTQIPLSKLRRAMRDNWRAAQPSFNCDRATTAVEKALCADVELARLDRQLAEAYWWKLQLADGEAAKAREREAQRSFLARRDATCASADARCLMSAYLGRLKDLNARPD
jgi:peptidoglycan-N-acetylglucosamine deacetylase